MWSGIIYLGAASLALLFWIASVAMTLQDTGWAARRFRQALGPLYLIALILAVVGGALQWWIYTNEQHLAWTVHSAGLALLVGSGLVLGLDADASGALVRSRAWLGSLVVIALVGVTPTVLVTLHPNLGHGPRNTGEPAARIAELVPYTFGAERPGYLAPATDRARERGIDYLPHEVKAPLELLLVGAWGLVLINLTRTVALLAGPAGRRRGAFVPAAIVPFALVLPLPFGLNGSAVWRSDPFLLESLGWLLVLGPGSLALPLVAGLLSKLSGPSGARPTD